MQLVPCTQCRRHVDAGESACPFCGCVVVERPRLASPRGKLTRAAVFSAALAGCNSKQEPPKPAPAPAQQQGSDDLEKMLDGDHHVDRPAAPVDASVAMEPVDAAVMASQPVDAGSPLDVAVPTRGHGHHVRVHKEGPPPPPPPPPPDDPNNPNWHANPKPYGAPPARRRLV